MKVKELIEELSRYNPNAEVEGVYNNDTFSIDEIVDKTFATFYPTVLIGLENQNLKQKQS